MSDGAAPSPPPFRRKRGKREVNRALSNVSTKRKIRLIDSEASDEEEDSSATIGSLPSTQSEVEAENENENDSFLDNRPTEELTVSESDEDNEAVRRRASQYESKSPLSQCPNHQPTPPLEPEGSPIHADMQADAVVFSPLLLQPNGPAPSVLDLMQQSNRRRRAVTQQQAVAVPAPYVFSLVLPPRCRSAHLYRSHRQLEIVYKY